MSRDECPLVVGDFLGKEPPERAVKDMSWNQEK